jgi:hypothetical protein
MSFYDVAYADRGTALVLKADLERGWRKLEKTYGFFTHKKIHYKRDWSIRAQLSVIAQPATFNERAASFPDVEGESGNELVGYVLGHKRLEVRIGLKEDQPWRIMSTGRPGLFIENLPLFRSTPELWFDLRAWVVFHAPPTIAIKDVRVWCQQLFVPGGQFESNRRNH